MAKRFETILRVKPRDNLGDPQFWNGRFEDLDRRIDANETALDNLDAVADRIEGVALDRLNQVLTPIVVETISRVREIPAMFSASSTSLIENGLGERSFVIAEGQRNTFAHLGHVMLLPHDGAKMGMVGKVIEYNAVTGLMRIDVEVSWGTQGASKSSWDITTSLPPDAHLSNTDNPHNVTAAQVGAYTKQEVQTLLSQLKNEIVGGASSAMDTLKELQDALASNELADRKYAKKQSIIFG